MPGDKTMEFINKHFLTDLLHCLVISGDCLGQLITQRRLQIRINDNAINGIAIITQYLNINLHH